MPFKIVRTIEKGKFKLWIAPSLWENNNVVKWPKSNALNLCKNENSLPGPDWRKKNCHVKRTDIPTYEDAERELSKMLDKTDTDDDVADPTVDPIFFKNRQLNENKPLNLNSLVQEVMTNQEGQSLNTMIPGTASEPSEIIITNETFPTYCVLDGTMTSSNITEILENQKLLLENQNKLFEIITEKHREEKLILENQQKILHEVASIQIQIDNIIMMVHKEKECTTLEETRNTPDSLSFRLEKISNADELNKMESSLSDKNARERLKRSYSVVCSRGKGLDCAYMLIDVLFTRDFLCQCSWSGSSRDDGIKISLKCYKNVVTFFWEMIYNWDSTFSMKDNEIFFKNILKNANKRKNAKLERSSTSRKRAKQDKNRKDQTELSDNNIVENQENEMNNANIIEIAAHHVEKESSDAEQNVTLAISSGDIEIGPDSESNED